MDHSNLSWQEQLFCNYYITLRNRKEAAIRAGYPLQDADLAAEELWMKQEIQEAIQQMEQEVERRTLRHKVMSGLERLAFGQINDCIKLVFEGEDLDIDHLDLFSISEIKRPKDGALEIKLFDRLQALCALEKSLENRKEESTLPTLLKALDQTTEERS